MKKFAILTVVALAVTAALSLAACTSDPSSAGFTFDSGSFNAEGKTATIDLSGNPTTGFEWTVAQEGDGMTQRSQTYVSSTKGTETGGGGTYTFIYEGTKAGTTTLTFTYARSWETPATNKTATFTIVTDGAGKITNAKCVCSDGSGGEIKS